MGYESLPMEDYETLEQAFADNFALGEVITSRFFMGAYYLACLEATGEVVAVVVLSHETDGIRMFKAIPEGIGPVACCCPLSILSVLSDTADPTAKAWRERCWAWNEAVVEAFVSGDLRAADEIAVRLNNEAFGSRSHF